MSGTVHYATSVGRWVIAATVLGSGMAFLDSTVVNVALPAIDRDLDAGITGLQWTLDAYLVTLTALLLLGGSLGDLYGRRRIYACGLAGFTAASLLCGIAPTVEVLIAARALQGVGGALLVPGSLAIISASFAVEDRPRAIGAWSGLSGVSTALGPLLGGWLVDTASWRWVFLINVPLAGVAIWITLRQVPETRDAAAPRRPDIAGAAAASLGLAGISYALIEGPAAGGGTAVTIGALGVLVLVAFVVVETRGAHPMLPLEVFRSRQFSGANLTTLAVYAAVGSTFFLVVLELQLVLGYSALEAGTALLPITVLLLLLSARAGQLAQRVGPRMPMTVGPLVIAGGLILFSRIDDGTGYLAGVVPAAVVFGLGLALTVAPLTAAVLGAVEERHLGVGSGVNNAVARLAGLLAVAMLPGIVGLDAADGNAAEFSDGYAAAMLISAGLCVIGSAVAFVTIRRADPDVPAATQPAVIQPCLPAGCREEDAA